MKLSDFQALCSSRRSVRAFTEDSPTEKQLLSILECARCAPSVQNVQPWHFHIVTKPDLRASIMDSACYGNFTTGNPTLVVVTCDTSATPDDQEVLWNARELEYSCMGAMEHALLGATAAGLGGCWVSFHHGPVHAALRLRQTDLVVGGILIGHPDTTVEAAGEHTHRKELTDIVSIHE